MSRRPPFQTVLVETVLALALPALGACASAPPEPVSLVGPAVEITIERAPAAAAQDASEPAPLGVRWRLFALDSLPEDALEPLAARTRSVTATKGATPFRAAAQLGAGARIGVGVAAEDLAAALASAADTRAVPIGERSATLGSGSIALDVAAAEPVADPARGPVRARLALELTRNPDGTVAAALVLQDVIAVDDARAPAGSEPHLAPMYQRERIAISEPVPTDGTPFALVLRSPFGAAPAAIALVLTLDPAAADPEALAEAAPASEAESDAESDALPTLADANELRGIGSALVGLDPGPHRRRALAWLAALTEAALAADLALIASEDLLGTLATRIAASGERAAPTSAAAAGWMIESAAYLVVVDRLETEGVAPEIEGVLLRRAGQLGRFPSALRAAVTASPDRASFQRRLTAENRTFLLDGDPSARVRAYDWLAARAQAPQGYDPLGTLGERRAAVVAAAEAGAEDAGGPR